MKKGKSKEITLIKQLEKKSKELKELILTISYEAQVGHIGPALSIVDIITVLYFDVLKINVNKPKWDDRDRFILSKGHAVAALYSVLYLKKYISKQILNSYCKNGGILGEHPEVKVPGVELSTGSLGHGLSVGAGIALAGKINKKSYKTYVLISDAECNEGEIWQAASFASHHKLSNLIVIIDKNNVQALGTTAEVQNMEPLSAKWAAFGWDVIETDGHNIKSLRDALLLKRQDSKPLVIIANTVRGKSVSFMEHHLEWHYFTVNKKQFIQALKDIKK